MIEPDAEYPNGGRVIPCPTNDASIKLQRDVIRDIKLESEGTIPAILIRDRGTGKMLTRAQFFDAHALTMLVIAEVEARAKV